MRCWKYSVVPRRAQTLETSFSNTPLIHWYRSKVFAWRKSAAPVVEAMTFFERGYLTKKVPLSSGVAKNSGSAPPNCQESPMNLSDPEFLATGSEPYRYPLAPGPEGVTLEGRKMAVAGIGGALNERGPMPTLLNDTNPLLQQSKSSVQAAWLHNDSKWANGILLTYD